MCIQGTYTGLPYNGGDIKKTMPDKNNTKVPTSSGSRWSVDASVSFWCLFRAAVLVGFACMAAVRTGAATAANAGAMAWGAGMLVLAVTIIRE